MGKVRRKTELKTNKFIRTEVPLKKFGSAEVIANLVNFLAEEMIRNLVNGSVIVD